MKEIVIVAALGKNNAMGLNNTLPWHLPKDFAHFKSLTSGHSLIMGRKTLESLPAKLKNRDHIVVTNNPNYKPKFEVEHIAYSLEQAIALTGDQKVFIAGGAQIYAQALPLATEMVLTHVDHPFEADTFFPEFSDQQWKIQSSELHLKDEKNRYDFSIVTYRRS
jgi:dihydrofolate reductase